MVNDRENDRSKYALWIDPKDVIPYELNAKIHTENQVENIANSIRRFGWQQDTVITSDKVLVIGHGRRLAALKLGCMMPYHLIDKTADQLTDEDIRELRILDNKISLETDIDMDALQADLDGLSFEGFEFPELTDEQRRKASWQHICKRCDLKKKISVRESNGSIYTSFFSAGKSGRPIDEIKEDPALVRPLADSFCDYVLRNLGANIRQGDWCLCTTPRRRHREGFHFATEICRNASKQLGIPFCEEAMISNNRRRVETDFELVRNPKERNIILYDDIITTGMTIRDSRRMLVEAGHVVIAIISIRNQ